MQKIFSVFNMIYGNEEVNMKRGYLIASLVFLFLFPLCGKDTITQISTIDALLAGLYDGQMVIGKLMDHGDVGIGTFEALDGEMIVMGGRIYQVRADGKVYSPPLNLKTPFATVSRFNPEKTLTLEKDSDYEKLKKILDHKFPNQNIFYTIRLEGEFSYMKTRSVPAQKKPYPPLSKVTQNQPEFEMKNISGTIVGFRCPPYVKGINVPGYHLHFLSKDRKKGGHILNFTLEKATCQIDICNQYHLILPMDKKEFQQLDLSKDRSQELKKVEMD